uniref:Uncharacterized protein n=1 Tax=Marseillevirus LCMAC101 TaxID=2506602 RepID=A0A481YRI2_9VIRU|nr:MAG: hypothetical protein LCMAC101_04260 [Marseillevirus LCMAC101]
MASDEEKIDVINLVGEFDPIEWPWNKLEIATARKNAVDLVHSLGNESTDFITCMLVMRELLISELVIVHGSSDYYDEQDGGQLSALLLTVDNFTLEQNAVTATAIQNLILNLDSEVYVPGYCSEKDLENNIMNDVGFIMNCIEDWCQISGHEDWLTSP